MMIIYLGADLTDAKKEVVDTRGAHVRFKFLGDLIKTNYKWLWMSTMMIYKSSTTDNVHLGVTSCS